MTIKPTKTTEKTKKNHRPTSVIFSCQIAGIGGGAVEKLNVFGLQRWKIPLNTFKKKENKLPDTNMTENTVTTEKMETIVANAEKGDVEKLGEMQEMHEWVMCPISYCIFRNPVLAEDGYLYEHDCIYRWFSECREGETGLVSPLTKETLACSKLVPCQMARQMVAQYLTLYPEKRSNQYVCTFAMKTMMHYMYHSVNLGENYLRSVDAIELDKDITFQQMQRCVKIIHNRDPLLRISLWEAFFRKIKDIHIPFKDEKQEFTFEDIATEEGYEPGGGTWVSDILTLRNMLDLEEEDLEESMARLSVNPVLPISQESETLEEGEIVERDDEETVVEERGSGSSEDGEEDGSSEEEGGSGEDRVIPGPPPLERHPAAGLTIDVSTTESSDESGEIVRPRIPLVMRHLYKQEQEHQEQQQQQQQQQNQLNYKRGLLGCLCFYGNKRILLTFLKVMPKITCPEIAGKYPHLIEDFFRRQHLMPERVRKMRTEERERLEDILIFMIDKGIPYHVWTRNGKQTVLSMLYFALDKFHPGTFSKLQRKIINLPEFFLIPPGLGWGSLCLSIKDFLRDILGKSEGFYMALSVWDIYQQSNKVELRDIWEFCVKYSRHNIWNEDEWNRNSFYEKVLLDFVKARGSIPLELVLLHTFSSAQLNHLFIEGFQIELPVGGGGTGGCVGITFPKHEQILPPIIKEDTVFLIQKKQRPFTGEFAMVAEEKPVVGPQKWKIQKHTPGGRLQISRRNYSTEWAWDSNTGVAYGDSIGDDENLHEKVEVSTIQPSPVMSVLGWLIHHYDAPIVHQYLIQNKELEIDMNSVEFTGLEYVRPMHLVFRYYHFSKNVGELLTEMVRRGADMTLKTSHGWLPIHYACRYSPNLVEWILENIPGKEEYINAPVCYKPSEQTVKLFESYREWNKSYLPLELFVKNHTINSLNKEVLGLLILSGAKNANQLKMQECFKNQPFLMETPVVFEMGSGGNGGRISRKRK